MAYSKSIGRLYVRVDESGVTQHGYRHGGTLACLNGSGNYDPNDPDDGVQSNLSVEEMRDLRYLLDRAIAAADEGLERLKARR